MGTGIIFPPFCGSAATINRARGRRRCRGASPAPGGPARPAGTPPPLRVPSAPPSCGHRAGDRSGVPAARGLRPPSPAERAGPERIPGRGAGSRAVPGLRGLLPAAPGQPRPRQRGDTGAVVSGEPPAPSVAPSGFAAGPGVELPWAQVPRGAGGGEGARRSLLCAALTVGPLLGARGAQVSGSPHTPPAPPLLRDVVRRRGGGSDPAAQQPCRKHAADDNTHSFIFINLAAVAAVTEAYQMGHERAEERVEDGGICCFF